MALKQTLLWTQVIFAQHWKNFKQQSEPDFFKCVGIVLLCDAFHWLPSKLQQKMKCVSCHRVVRQHQLCSNNLRRSNKTRSASLLADCVPVDTSWHAIKTVFLYRNIFTLIMSPSFFGLCLLARITTERILMVKLKVSLWLWYDNMWANTLSLQFSLYRHKKLG